MATRSAYQVLDRLFTVLTPEKVDALAKETGFIQRKRTLSASDFLSLLFQFQGNVVGCTLQDLCGNLAAQHDISVSRTAIDKKFTMHAVHFLQRLVQELFLAQSTLQLTSHLEAKDWPFNSIRVIDATEASVPDHLKARARKTRQTPVKIQYEFDVLTGRLTFFHLDFKKLNDASMGAKRVPFLEEKELCLQDLGYFRIQSLKDIQEQGSYFLSKFRSNAYLAFENPFPDQYPDGEAVQNTLYHKIDLVGLSQNMKPGEILELEEVHFGLKAHFPARCILLSRDEAQTNVRLDWIDRRASKSCKKPLAIVREMAGVIGYMTNLPETVPPERVLELYRLRWQIELIFKTLKSQLKMKQFKLVKLERWLCHLYGTLLVLLLSQLIAYQLRNMIWEEEAKEISETVAIRSIAREGLSRLYEDFRHKKKAFEAFIHSMSCLLIKTARKPHSAQGTALNRLQFT